MESAATQEKKFNEIISTKITWKLDRSYAVAVNWSLALVQGDAVLGLSPGRR